MQYAVVHTVKNKPAWVEEFRHKLDPQAPLINAHFTLVFPFEVDASELPNIQSQIRSIVERQAKINLRVGKIDYREGYIFLLPFSNDVSITFLHDELYALDGLRQFLDSDRLYAPHITIGQYSTDSKSIADLARLGVSDSDTAFEILVDSIELIEIDRERGEVSVVETYMLASN